MLIVLSPVGWRERLSPLRWQGRHWLLPCETSPSSRPAERTVVLAPVSSLGLRSLKSSNKLEGSGYSGIASVVACCKWERFPPKAFEKHRDGPTLHFASSAGLCAPLPAGFRVNGALVSTVSSVNSLNGFVCNPWMSLPSQPACVTAVTLPEVAWKDLGAGVVLSCPLEVPPSGKTTWKRCQQRARLIGEGRIGHRNTVWCVVCVSSSPEWMPVEAVRCSECSSGFSPAKPESKPHFHGGKNARWEVPVERVGSAFSRVHVAPSHILNNRWFACKELGFF